MADDPFTLAVVQAGLEAAAAEMFATLRKTAMSPIIYEVLDVGTGVTDADGALVSSGAGIPSFVGVLDKSVTAILAARGSDIAEGDVFILNDPNHGGVTHLNDVVIAEPVFFEERRVAWVASIAHWGDIGGRVAGSMATDVTGIVAEGLRLPVVRLFAGGRPNAAIFDLVRANSRLPDFVTGDLNAQVAAGRRAAALIRGLCARYGTGTLSRAIAEARALGEARARAGLSSLPEGRIGIEAPLDGGETWRAAVEISGDRFTVDLRDAPEQHPGPHNTSRDGAVIACQMLFKALTDPERFANAGSFAPLRVLTRPGSIFHAGPQAAHGYYFETRMRLFDMLWRGLAAAMPGRLPAGHFATIFGTVIAGRHPDTGRAFAMVEPQMGGWGATGHRDGQGPLFSTNHGDTFHCPVVIGEARYGLEVMETSLLPASAVAGCHAGGPGLRKRYRLRGAASISAGLSHGEVPVWSAAGCPPGGTNSLRVDRPDGSGSTHRFVSGLALGAGDVVTLDTAHGGAVRAGGGDDTD